MTTLAIGCTTFTYTKDQLQSLAIHFKLNWFRFAPAIDHGMEIFATNDPSQISCIAGLIDKIKAFADGNRGAFRFYDNIKNEWNNDAGEWVQESLNKVKSE